MAVATANFDILFIYVSEMLRVPAHLAGTWWTSLNSKGLYGSTSYERGTSALGTVAGKLQQTSCRTPVNQVVEIAEIARALIRPHG
jgi:hypothetical protein